MSVAHWQGLHVLPGTLGTLLPAALCPMHVDTGLGRRGHELVDPPGAEVLECDVSSSPGLGRSSGDGNGNPFQYSCLEKSHGQRLRSMGLQELDLT